MKMQLLPRLGMSALVTFRAPRRSPEWLRSVAARRLARILEGASRVPFHRERLIRAGLPAGALPSPEEAPRILAALPPLTKAELRDAGAGALAGGGVRPEWRSSRSSGSTGEPFRVHYDPVSWMMLKHLVKLRARLACGLRIRDRLAILDALLPGEMASAPLERAGRVRRISILAEPELAARELAEFAPDVIYGLPSALLDIAGALQKDLPPPTPRLIFTSGEVLAPGSRRTIADGYGARVLDVYGTSETKEIAWECLAGSLHVNADVVLLEVLDSEGRALPAGSEGDLVATLLLNDAMPLLRYRTGDRGRRLDGRCACGIALPRVEAVTGRVADTVRLPDGRLVSPYVFTTALESVPGVARFRVRQVAPERFLVLLRAAPGAAALELTRQVQRVLTTRIPGIVEPEVEFVDDLERGAGGKLRVVEPLPRELWPG